MAFSTGRAASSASCIGPVAQLEEVAEDDEPVDAVEGGEQRVLGGGTAQDVDVAAGPEMEVRDHEGAHGACRLLCAAVAAPRSMGSSSPTSRGCSPGPCAR